MSEPTEVPVSDLRPSREVQEFEDFVPILDRILLSRIESDKDKSGFTIPDKYREPEAKGIVVAIGDGVVLGGVFHPMSKFVNVGDECLFGAHTVEKIEMDGKEFEICRLQDIRGVRRLKKKCDHQWQPVMAGVAKCFLCDEMAYELEHVPNSGGYRHIPGRVDQLAIDKWAELPMADDKNA
jgi:co-chaperonin GroES (HSP10)